MITSTSWACWPARTEHRPGSGTTTSASGKLAGQPRNATGCGAPSPRIAPRDAAPPGQSTRRRAATAGPKLPALRCAAPSARRPLGQPARESSSPGYGRLACWCGPRLSVRDTGQVTGYAVALAGDTARGGGAVWFGGGKLAADLSLPKLRGRWDGASAAPQLGNRLRPGERNAIWEHAARAAQDACDQIRFAAGDPAVVSDAAWAASDTLHVAAAALGSRVVRRAADSYARAARVPYARIPRRTPAGDGLRRAARLLSAAAFAGHDPVLAQIALIGRLAALAEAVAELRETQQRAAQAAAARNATGHLHAAAGTCPPRPARPRTRTAATPGSVLSILTRGSAFARWCSSPSSRSITGARASMKARLSVTISRLTGGRSSSASQPRPGPVQ